MNLNFGDTIDLQYGSTSQINKIYGVYPIRFDTINENWIVCQQNKATHMLLVVDTYRDIDSNKTEYIMIEIGKCDNIYMLADAIVD